MYGAQLPKGCDGSNEREERRSLADIASPGHLTITSILRHLVCKGCNMDMHVD